MVLPWGCFGDLSFSLLYTAVSQLYKYTALAEVWLGKIHNSLFVLRICLLVFICIYNFFFQLRLLRSEEMLEPASSQ